MAATLAGKGIVEARITMPLLGAWTCDAYVDSTEEISGPVSIAFDGGLTFGGYARPERTGVHLDAVLVRVVGGAGGLRSTTTPRDYKNCPLRLPLGDLLAAAGEAVAGASDASTLATQLPHWTTMRQATGTALSALVAAVPGAGWRVLADGSIYVGPETWPALDIDCQLVDDAHHDASTEIAVDAPTLYPGVTWTDDRGTAHRIGHVEHVITPDKIRTFAWFVDALRPRDLMGSTQAMVRTALPTIDYFARYDATLVAQSTDRRSVDVRLDDTRFGDGLSGIPLELGLPGAKAQIDVGARVLVGWRGGDPRWPYAEAFPGGETVPHLWLDAARISLAGSATPAPLWSTFESDLSTLLSDIATQLALGTAGTALAQQLVGNATIQTKIAAFRVKLAGGNFDSTKVENG